MSDKENAELVDLEELVAELNSDDMDAVGAPSPQPQTPAQPGQPAPSKYMPWVACGGVIAGPKGVFIIPKGQGYPQPVARPMAAPAPAAPAQPPVPVKMEDNAAPCDKPSPEEQKKMDEEKKLKDEADKKMDEMSATLEDLKKQMKSKEEEIDKLKNGRKLSRDAGADLSMDKESTADTLFRAFGSKQRRE